jgi:hypothetical protein
MLVKVHIIVSYITTWCCGPEDGGSVFLWNVGNHPPDCMV